MKKRNFIKFLVSPLLMSSASVWSQVVSSSKNRTKTKPIQKNVIFGLITPRNAEQTLKSWNPFLERMSNAIGQTFEAKTYDKAGDLVNDFKNGVIDYAWLGNVPAIELVEARVGGVFGQLVVNGKFAYRSLLITHKDSQIRNLQDILASNKKYIFGDGDLKSTSGHVVPRYYAFAKKGFNDVDAMFKSIKRGSHIDNLNRVVSKEVDFATNNTTELSIFTAANPALAKEIRVVWESPDIPESPLVWRLDLPKEPRKKVQNFMVSFGKNEDERLILKQMNDLTAFRRSSNSQLINVADIEGFNARQRLINDPSLTAEDRASKIEAVIQRGSRLEFLLKQSTL